MWQYLICADFSGGGNWVPAKSIFGKVIAIERNGCTLSFRGWRGRLWGWWGSRLWCKLSTMRRFLCKFATSEKQPSSCEAAKPQRDHVKE
jgi:hypothetical protein